MGTSEHRPEGSKKESHADIGEESFLGRGNSKFNISEVGAACLAGILEENKEA